MSKIQGRLIILNLPETNGHHKLRLHITAWRYRNWTKEMGQESFYSLWGLCRLFGGENLNSKPQCRWGSSGWPEWAMGSSHNGVSTGVDEALLHSTAGNRALGSHSHYLCVRRCYRRWQISAQGVIRDKDFKWLLVHSGKGVLSYSPMSCYPVAVLSSS